MVLRHDNYFNCKLSEICRILHSEAMYLTCFCQLSSYKVQLNHGPIPDQLKKEN